jgi:hypothetical protein
MARLGHRLHAGAPAVEKLLAQVAILGEDGALGVGTLPRGADLRLRDSHRIGSELDERIAQPGDLDVVAVHDVLVCVVDLVGANQTRGGDVPVPERQLVTIEVLQEGLQLS